MSRHAIAIVGRPNVGKSTLFNTLVGSRIAIEAPTSGVTRDRVLVPVTVEDRAFDLLDTGGIGMVDRQDLEGDVSRQIDVAIDEATALLFVVDVRDGITPLDEEVADRLRRIAKPVLLVAAKADTLEVETAMPSFHALGFGDALAVSAKHRRNLDALREAMAALLPETAEEADDLKGLLKIAFVGRRNVGKSSLVNQLVGADRVIVSDRPGTTRDSLDILVEREGERFVAIDTAGLRRRGQMDDIMEFYGQLRSERAVRRADVAVLLLDATDEVSKVDKRLGSLILEEFTPCLLALNKWDLVREANPKVRLEDFQDYLRDRLAGLWFCPLAGISAKTGENVWPLIRLARDLAAQARREVGTGALNRAIEEAQRKRRPKPQRGKVGKMYYATQIGVAPPTFLVFCNNPRFFDDSYTRFLQNHLRQRLGCPDIPLRIRYRSSHEEER